MTVVGPSPTLGEDEAPDAAPAVVVRLGGGRYALDMAAVAEVGRVPALTRVPGVPPWLAGVANWRGRILAVVDLRPLLATPAGPLGPGARLAVLRRDGLTVGVLTEGVDGVLVVAAGEVDPPPGTLTAEAAELLLGTRTDDRGPVAMVSVDAVLALRGALARARRAG